MKEIIAILATSVLVTDFISVSWLWLLAVVLYSVKYLSKVR